MMPEEEVFTHPWQPARLIGWNSVWVGQCDLHFIVRCCSACQADCDFIVHAVAIALNLETSGWQAT